MKKILQFIGIAATLTVGNLNAQIYLTENFDTPFTGSPSAPTGWVQSRLVIVGDGTPEPAAITGEKDWEQNINTGAAAWSIVGSSFLHPNTAFSGTGALYLNDNNFSALNALGNRRMITPTVNLSASTNPFIRFWMFYPTTGNILQLRLLASNDGGLTYKPINWVYPNSEILGTMTSATPWQNVSIPIPAAYKVANAIFALELTPSGFFQNSLFIDNFSVEELIPTTITSAGSGGWNLPATWAGGVVPTSSNNAVIATGHTVSMNLNAERVHNLTIDGGLTYSTTTAAHCLQVFNNLTISATGSYTSGTGVLGKRTYVGNNFVNNGSANFANGTSTSGGLFWVGLIGNYSGSGTLVNGRVPYVSHTCANGVTYSSSFTISSTCDLILGDVNATNLTLGNAPFASSALLTNRAFGSFIGVPTSNTVNINQRSLTYIISSNTGGVFYVESPQTLIAGDEIELILGNRVLTGVLTLSTFNNVQLNYPLTVGTLTTGGLNFGRGILITTPANLLTCNQNVVGAVGTTPTTVITTGTLAGNHGSYVSGPLRINFPTATTITRNFPLGQGTAFNTNNPSTNALRSLSLSSGSILWNGQTITATIENAPSGIANIPLTSVLGSRAYRLNYNGGPALPTNANLTLNFNNSTFGGSDNLLGTLQNLRIIQSPSITGPWSERSLTAGTGLVLNNTPGSRLTTSVSPGPINNGDEYFAWGTTNLSTDIQANIFLSPLSLGCYGANQTVSVSIINSGISAINFATNPATISVFSAGASNFTFTPFVINSGTLAASASQSVVISTTFNMSAIGIYSFTGNVSTAGDIIIGNDIFLDITRTVTTSVALPQSVNFNGFTGANLNTVFPNWTEGSGFPTPTLTTSNWISQTNLNGVLTNTTSRINLFTTSSNVWIVGPKVTPTAFTELSFDVAVSNWMAPTVPDVMGSDDMLRVMVSTNCGLSFTPIFTVNASNALTLNLTNFNIPLGTFAGQDITVAFLAQDGPIDNLEDYDLHLDNINLLDPPANDVGATALVSPSVAGCYSSAETVSITIRNYGTATQTLIPVTVIVSGAVTQTLTNNYTGSLPPNGTVNVNVGTLNMLTTGTYSFAITTGLVGDATLANDLANAVRNVFATLPLPYSEDFNTATTFTVPLGYTSTGSPFLSVLANHGQGYSNNAVSGNVWGSTNILSVLTLPKMGPVGANTTFKYDYRIQDWSGYPSSAATTTVLLNNDSLNVYVSTNCGLTFSLVQTITGTNHIPSLNLTAKSINLAPYSGNDVILRFIAKKQIANSGDYFVDIDNINICSLPAAPVSATALICAGNSATLSTVATGTVQWYATATPTAYLAQGNTFITPTLTSNTTYYLLDSTACGLSGITAVNITVNVVPSVSIAGSSTICVGQPANITASGATTYTWNTGATTASIAPTPITNTTYTVTGANGTCTNVAVKAVTVNPLPVVSLSAAQTTACTNSSTITLTGSPAGGTYTGTNVSGTVFTPGASVGTFVPTYAFTNTLTGCSNTASTTIVVSICTGLNAKTNSAIGIQVFPNPNTGMFTIELVNGLTKNIVVSDLTGRIVLEQTTTADVINVNISNLANGVYYVKVLSNNNTDILKVIKQ